MNAPAQGSRQPRCIVVTAADDHFMPLLQGLMASLRQPHVYPCDIACMDLGIGPVHRHWLQQYTALVPVPGWDLPVCAALRTTQSHLRAMTVRPFLPQYFPGYDVYLWMDADTWLQDPAAVERYVRAASFGSMALTRQDDPAYTTPPQVRAWRVKRLRRYYGTMAADWLEAGPYFNSGIFALRRDAPHWECWAARFRHGLRLAESSLCCDQTALNYALWNDRLAVRILPPTDNWTCHLSIPTFDVETGHFLQPTPPHAPIGVMHLTGDSKNAMVPSRDPHGRLRMVDLRFRRRADPSRHPA